MYDKQRTTLAAAEESGPMHLKMTTTTIKIFRQQKMHKFLCVRFFFSKKVEVYIFFKQLSIPLEKFKYFFWTFFSTKKNLIPILVAFPNQLINLLILNNI